MKKKGADLTKATNGELVTELESRWNVCVVLCSGTEVNPVKIQSWRKGNSMEMIGLLDAFSEHIRQDMSRQFWAAEHLPKKKKPDV
ncbi:MAG: hypothetical protein IMZ57_04030 [Acidobacteria bacterium]|nr:hypothetical protein [Acidobacteriota bacterium]